MKAAHCGQCDYKCKLSHILEEHMKALQENDIFHCVQYNYEAFQRNLIFCELCDYKATRTNNRTYIILNFKNFCNKSIILIG